MDAAHTNSIRQWAQQLYGPPSRTPTDTLDLVEKLVHAKRHADRLTFGSTSPSKHPLPQDDASSHVASTSWYDETWNNDNFHRAMTTGTTANRFLTNDPTTDESYASGYSTTPASLATEELAQPSDFTNWPILPPLNTRIVHSEDHPAPPPGNLMNPSIYIRLSRIEQLEYLIRLKITIFRQQLGVPCIFRNMRLWNIDWEERDRRRKFFEKNGDEAYLARYIDSDYVGRVEFHYITPEEVY